MTDDSGVRATLTHLLDPEELDAVMAQPNRPMWILFRHAQQIYEGMSSGIYAGFDAFQQVWEPDCIGAT